MTTVTLAFALGFAVELIFILPTEIKRWHDTKMIWRAVCGLCAEKGAFNFADMVEKANLPGLEVRVYGLMYLDLLMDRGFLRVQHYARPEGTRYFVTEAGKQYAQAAMVRQGG